ncbi:G-protein coupled receptor 4-like [Lates calcarifer]|uniref:G-protein coupled receptor 4-like n=2 Tax=Lates calcarifer TaxID=8187 RepID=A0AAJ7L9R4_LATCA|nr:G-protein coupled receptor 4-like [Lates calcarifer]
MEAFYNHSKSQLNDTFYNVTSSSYESGTMSTVIDRLCGRYTLWEIFSPTIACIVIFVGFPLTLLAIYSLYSQVQNDHVAPIFVINLLISDLIQICCLMVWVVLWFTFWESSMVYCVSSLIYYGAVLASAGFMVCIAVERYLVVAWPLWYRFRRSIKFSVMVSIIVWVFCFTEFIISYFKPIFRPIILLLPFPLLVFSLAGTLKALCTIISIPPKEKRQIVGTLVLVLLNYILLFLPWVTFILIDCCSENYDIFYDDSYDFLWYLAEFVQFSPLADLILYVLIRKGATEKLLISMCCCRMLRDEEQVQVATINE